MAQIDCTIHASKRSFFWPLLVIIVGLGKCGILRSQERAAKWMANHAMRLEVRG